MTDTLTILRDVPGYYEIVLFSAPSLPPFDGEKFWLFVTCCRNPFCDCVDIHILLFLPENLDPTKIQYEFIANTVTRKTRIIGSVSDPKMALNILNDCLSDADWEQLHRQYNLAKMRLIENLEGNEENLDFDFPTEIIKNPGTYIAFETVFPLSQTFFVVRKNATYFIFDQYCVNPTCNCSTVSLDVFIELETHSSYAFLFNYASNKIELNSLLNTDADTANELLQDLQDKHDDIAEMLQHRHYLLRQMSIRDSVRRPLLYFGPQGGKIPIARNAPCPCGSGKQYKRCCGK
jgi:SEC-C motif domain protein